MHDPTGPANSPDYQPGDWVEIEGFLRAGRIKTVDVQRHFAEVEVSGIVWKVKLDRLRRSASARERGERAARENQPPAYTLPVLAGSDVIDLHGVTVEEGLALLDKFLDTALVNDCSSVKIIHGHGSGRLRTAVRAFIATHPNVADYRFGAPWEGGFAVTIVHLGRRRA